MPEYAELIYVMFLSSWGIRGKPRMNFVRQIKSEKEIYII